MQKEIFEQPESVVNTMRGRICFDRDTGTAQPSTYQNIISLAFGDHSENVNSEHTYFLHSCSRWSVRPSEGDQKMQAIDHDWLRN